MSNIEIAVRVRPLIEREKKENLEPLWEIKEKSMVQTNGLSGDPYIFDHIFNENQSNADLYHTVVKPLVLSCLEGINATILAYGQTSSGKTHTVVGTKDNPGVITHAVNEIFNFINNDSSRDFLLRCSYLEIYNEKVNDLLNVNGMDLKVREDYNQQVYVEKAQEEVIHTPDDFFSLMKRGMKTRKIGCTDMNERSSRSHTILKLVIQSQCKASEGSFTESVLSLVDLAGSERVGQMSMDRSRQVEGVSINKSLTTLALVIRRLSENDTFVNYRDSKLTRLLQHSLGGNSKTLIIATVTVAASEETKSTLEFAQRAKMVKNRPEVNRRVTDKDQLKLYERLCDNYKSEIEKLYLEKLEKERTIDALNGKISNIRLFTDLDSKRSSSVQKIRRHTMWSHSQNQQNVSSPMLAVTPPAKLRLEKQLLEVSYERLKEFTNLERQFTGESFREHFDDYQELVARLREENCNCQLTQKTILSELRDTKEHLLTLKRLLADQENNVLGFLGTIIEEDFGVFELENDEINQLQDQELSKLQLKNEEAEVLERKVVELKKENTIKEQDLIDLRLNLCDKEEKLSELQKLISNKMEEIKCLNSTVQTLNDKLENANQVIVTKDRELSKLQLSNNESDVLERKLAEMKKENSIKELDVIDLRLNLCDKEEKLSKLQKLISNKMEEIKSLNSTVQTLNDKLENANQAIVTKDRELSKLHLSNKESDVLESKLAEMKKENTIKEQDVIDLRLNLCDREEKLLELQKLISNKMEEIDRLTATLQTLYDKLENANEVIISKDRELSELHLANKESDVLERKLAEMKKENTIKEQDVIDLRLNLCDKEKKLSELQRLISNKMEEIDRLTATLQTLNNKLEDANQVIITKDRELSKLHFSNKESDVLERKLAEMKKENTIKEQEVRELGHLRKCLADKDREIQRLGQKLSKSDPFKEKYDNNVTTLDQSDTEENSFNAPFEHIFDDFNTGAFINENSDLKRELKRTKASHNAYETKCRQQGAVIDRLTETNLKTTETVEKLKEELREARRQRSATPPQSDCLSLSPDQLRKIKRRSIHDQRRGISPGSEDLRNTFTELHKESPTGRCGNRQSVQLVDKACQIEERDNTDIYRQEYEALSEKYTILQKVARYRRREANHLRHKLNIPPDAPVLPALD